MSLLVVKGNIIGDPPLVWSYALATFICTYLRMS